MNPFVRWIRLSGIVAILIVGAEFGTGQPPKPVDIPTAAEIKAAVETLRDVYDKDYALAEKDSK